MGAFSLSRTNIAKSLRTSKLYFYSVKKAIYCSVPEPTRMQKMLLRKLIFPSCHGYTLQNEQILAGIVKNYNLKELLKFCLKCLDTPLLKMLDNFSVVYGIREDKSTTQSLYHRPIHSSLGNDSTFRISDKQVPTFMKMFKLQEGIQLIYCTRSKNLHDIDILRHNFK